MKQLIEKLTQVYGPSGFEDEVRELIRSEVEPHVDSVFVDALGNLIARKQGSGDGKKLMVAAHMDEIGLMVSHVDDDGFLRFARIGGVNNLNLNGARVRFADGTIGIIYAEKRDSRTKIHDLDKFYIDVGASSADDAPVGVGQAAVFQEQMVDQRDRLISKAMDDRIGCAVAVAALQQLEQSPHDVSFVFTVQEEVGVRGAMTAAYRIQPDIAIALDVTRCGDTPNGPRLAVKLGEGPAIKVRDTGMIAHPGLVRLMKQRAEENDIPYQLEVLSAGSTDARAMQISGAGAAAGCISVPCRYVHSRSETVDYNDVVQAVELLKAMLSHPIEL